MKFDIVFVRDLGIKNQQDGVTHNKERCQICNAGIHKFPCMVSDGQGCIAYM